MNAIPKPQHCEQNWRDMKPAEGGRICGQCDKLIVDFSKMRWSQIEAIQQANNNSVCGMYSQKQLDNWGREIPESGCTKALAKVAFMLSLAASIDANAQTDTSNAKYITGHVYTTQFSGQREAIPGATVIVKGTQWGTQTDVDGNYRLALPPNTEELTELNIEFRSIACKTYELKVKLPLTSSANYNVPLVLKPEDPRTAFYVVPPKWPDGPELIEIVKGWIYKKKEKKRLEALGAGPK